MSLTTKIVGKKINARLRSLEAQVKSLQPLRSVGTLTGHTTVGVTRRAASDAGTGGKGSNAARWA